MQEELISVIVPIYNSEKYLEECLDSIIRQTYKNLEILLIDDGSPDNSIDICKRYEKLDLLCMPLDLKEVPGALCLAGFNDCI